MATPPLSSYGTGAAASTGPSPARPAQNDEMVRAAAAAAAALANLTREASSLADSVDNLSSRMAQLAPPTGLVDEGIG